VRLRLVSGGDLAVVDKPSSSLAPRMIIVRKQHGRPTGADMSMNQMERRAVLGLAVGGVIAFGGINGARARSIAAPAVPIEQLNAALLMAMKAGRMTAFGQRFNILAAAVDRSFDLETVLQNSIGPRWATLQADEQAQLRRVFRRYTIANYVANFDSYDGQSFTVAPEVQAVGNGDELVTTRIIASTGSSNTLSYVVRRTLDEWKAVDVLANGAISRVAVQRSDFRTLLGRGGGSALVASLQQKVVDLSGGVFS
jgi:phospholipid transport system substrate-binding protein